MPHTPCSSFHQQQPQEAEAGWNCTLLNLRLPALEEVESIGGFRVYMLHYGEDVENVFLCEGGLVPVVKVVFLQQYLEEPKKKTEGHSHHFQRYLARREEKEPGILHIESVTANCSRSTTWGQHFEGSVKVCTTTSVCWELRMQRHNCAGTRWFGLLEQVTGIQTGQEMHNQLTLMGTGFEVSLVGLDSINASQTSQGLHHVPARLTLLSSVHCTLLSTKDHGRREDIDLTWTPVLREISRRRVIFCRLYISAAWSAFSLQKAHTDLSSQGSFHSRTSLPCMAPSTAKCWMKPATIPWVLLVLTELHSSTEIWCALHSSLQGLSKSGYLQLLARSKLSLTWKDQSLASAAHHHFSWGPVCSHFQFNIQCLHTPAASLAICFRCRRSCPCFRNTSCLRPKSSFL